MLGREVRPSLFGGNLKAPIVNCGGVTPRGGTNVVAIGHVIVRDVLWKQLEHLLIFQHVIFSEFR